MGRYTGKKCRLISMFVLTAMYFLVEIVVGYVTNSMALVADSFHMLSDVAALVVAYLSVKMSPKKWSKNTFGWARAEVLGALVNAVFLVALCFSILVEAFKRFIEMETIHNPGLIVIVGSIGLVVNLIGLVLFHDYGLKLPAMLQTKTAVTAEVVSQLHQVRTGQPLMSSDSIITEHGHSHGSGLPTHGHSRLSHLVVGDELHESDDPYKTPPALPALPGEKKKLSGFLGHGHSHGGGGGGHGHGAVDSSQMNMRGVFLHVLADALGSVIVVISALIVWLTDWSGRFYIDPALSLILIVLILRSVWPLLQESALILLQTVPTHIQVDAIQRRLLDKVDGVLAVHEFHVWQLTGDRIIASAHIRCRNLSEYMKLAEKVKEFFHNEGIHSTTIQPEFSDDDKCQVAEDPSDCQPDTTTGADCVLDCPKTDQPCVQSTCCGPSKQGRDSPSPGDTPYLNCRQRCNSTLSLNRVQELPSEMERGRLLSPSCGNECDVTASSPTPSLRSAKESRV